MSLTIFNSIEKLKQDTTCLQYLNKDQKNFILNNKEYKIAFAMIKNPNNANKSYINYLKLD